MRLSSNKHLKKFYELSSSEAESGDEDEPADADEESSEDVEEVVEEVKETDQQEIGKRSQPGQVSLHCNCV